MLEIKRLSYKDAQVLLAGAATKAAEIGVPMCIAVVDESGNLIAFQRMDGGKVHSISLACDKAATAASSHKGTDQYNAAAVPGNLAFGIQGAWGGRFSTVGGGLPVAAEDVVVGGIGCSSGTPQQDMECAQAGIDALEESWRAGDSGT